MGVQWDCPTWRPTPASAHTPRAAHLSTTFNLSCVGCNTWSHWPAVIGGTAVHNGNPFYHKRRPGFFDEDNFQAIYRLMLEKNTGILCGCLVLRYEFWWLAYWYLVSILHCWWLCGLAGRNNCCGRRGADGAQQWLAPAVTRLSCPSCSVSRHTVTPHTAGHTATHTNCT